MMSDYAPLVSQPERYEVRRVDVDFLGHRLPMTVVDPNRPRKFECVVMYATGDDGWAGINVEVIKHLAEKGYTVVGFDSSVIVSHLEDMDGELRLSDADRAFDQLIKGMKRELRVGSETPLIFTGFSRGANFVVFCGGEPRVQWHLIGGVALGLTREADYLTVKDPQRLQELFQVDEKGRLQTYPAVGRMGDLPLAVIQASGDRYVAADESRQLLGPDSSTRRLYRIECDEHGFDGAEAVVLDRLDDALEWIESKAK